MKSGLDSNWVLLAIVTAEGFALEKPAFVQASSSELESLHLAHIYDKKQSKLRRIKKG